MNIKTYQGIKQSLFFKTDHLSVLGKNWKGLEIQNVIKTIIFIRQKNLYSL